MLPDGAELSLVVDAKRGAGKEKGVVHLRRARLTTASKAGPAKGEKSSNNQPGNPKPT
jgi:hypothetical protein